MRRWKIFNIIRMKNILTSFELRKCFSGASIKQLNWSWVWISKYIADLYSTIILTSEFPCIFGNWDKTTHSHLGLRCRRFEWLQTPPNIFLEFSKMRNVKKEELNAPPTDYLFMRIFAEQIFIFIHSFTICLLIANTHSTRQKNILLTNCIYHGSF